MNDTETDTINDISWFLPKTHGYRKELHFKYKSDPGKKQTRFLSFGTWRPSGTTPKYVLDSDSLVTLEKKEKIRL